MSSSDTTNNINDILTKLNNKISCDSSCQRQKKIDDLKNKWMNAEQRGANSEEEIEQAKMNYYLYAGGENAYNEVKNSEYAQSASDYSSDATNEMNQLQYEMNDSLDRYVYNTEHVQSLNELYEIKVKKNGEIENKIDEYNKITFTSQRKIVYENHDMNRIQTYHKIIIFLYYGLFLYYLVDGNFFADKLYKDRIMVSVFLFYLLFPFILKFVVRKLFDLANAISYAFNNKLHKNVYTNP
jgi:hypothetical protein